MIKVCAVTDLPEGGAVRLEGPTPIAVFHTEAGFFAIDDTCTHQDASLAEGYVEGCLVECPLHASCFDLRTGLPSEPPAKAPVATYPVEVRDGEVWLAVPAHAPA